MDKIFEALSHATRRAILELLNDGARSAGELADAFPVSKPTMSNHFAKLRDAGLVQSEQRGASIIYSLNRVVLEESVMGFMGRVGIEAAKRDD
jgi:ArsR family transcriptional regulator, arsenate/arsenite/antimonite-responsive transcriptional repressor